MTEPQNPKRDDPIAARAEAMFERLRAQQQENQSSTRLRPTPKEAETRRRLDAMRRRATGLIWTGDELEPGAGPSPGVTIETQPPTGAATGRRRIETLAPLARHRLDAALGAIRHSAVESCFYNLKLYAGMLATNTAPMDIDRKLTKAFAGLPEAARRLEAFLDAPIGEGIRVREILAEQSETIRDALSDLTDAGSRWRTPSDRAADWIRGAEARREGERIGRQIERIMATLAGAQARLDAQRIEIATLVEQAADSERPRLETAGIALGIDLEPIRGARLLLNPHTLSDAVIEILRNTVRHAFTETGTSHRTSERRVRIEGRWADRARQTVQILIRDNGRGIDAADLVLMGRRGFTTGGGTGEGLAMARRVVEVEHLGRLAIQSRPREGTTVVVELPVKANVQGIETKGEKP